MTSNYTVRSIKFQYNDGRWQIYINETDSLFMSSIKSIEMKLIGIGRLQPNNNDHLIADDEHEFLLTREDKHLLVELVKR